MTQETGPMVRLYGRTRVTAGDTEVVPGGAKQRGLLAMLALHPGRDVHADRIVDGLWDDGGPGDPAASIRVFASNLRKELGRGDPRWRDAVAGRYPLYSLAPPLGSDLAAARALRIEAIGVLDSDPYRAAALLDRAVALVSDPPLADVLHLPFARDAVATLLETRLELEDELAQARVISVGEERSLPYLRDLMAAAPGREARACILARTLGELGHHDEAMAVLDEHTHPTRPSAATVTLRASLLSGRSGHVRPRDAGALPVGLATHVPVVWAGRVAERAALMDEFESYGDERRLRIVEIVGVGGAGKTALAAIVARECARAGARVLYLGWHRTGSALRPLQDAGLVADTVDTSRGMGAPEGVAQVAVDALTHRDGTNPVVLVVDDLHWARGTARDVMARLVADPALDLLIVATRRPDPAVDGLSASSAVPVRTVELGPLLPSEIADLAAATGRPADATAEPALPWVVAALVRPDDGAARTRRIDLGLDALDPPEAQVVRHLAFDADGLRLATLSVACARPPADVLRSLRQLESDGLVEEAGEGRITRFRLCHDLVRERLAQRLGTAELEVRAALHEALDATDPHPSTRLHHALAAIDLLGEEAVATIDEACDEMLSVGLYGDLVVLDEHVRALRPAIPDVVAGHVAAAATFARSALGEGVDATGALLDEARRAASSDDWRGVTVALRLRNLLGHDIAADTEEDALVTSALAALGGDADPALRFELLWLRFMGALHAGASAEALRPLAASLAELAGESNDAALLGRASHVNHQVLTLEGAPRRRSMAASLRTLRHGRESGDELLVTVAQQDLHFDHLDNHDLESAAALVEELVDRRDPRGRWFGMMGRALHAIDRGALDEAEHLAADAHAAGVARGIAAATEAYLSQTFGIAWIHGSLGSLSRHFEAEDWRRPAGGVWGAAHALCLAQAGDARGAASLAADVAEHVVTADREGWLEIVVLALLAETAALVGARAPAEIAGDRLRRWAEGRVVTGAALDLGPVDRYRGLCAAVTGAGDAAADLFARAGEQAGCTLWESRIERDRGGVAVPGLWGWMDRLTTP